MNSEALLQSPHRGTQAVNKAVSCDKIVSQFQDQNMPDDIKKIIDSLDKTQDNLNKSKGTLSKWLDEVGYQIELTDEQKNLWSELDKQGNVPAPITLSGINMAQSLVQNSEEIAIYIDQSRIDQAIYTASAIGESIAGTAISGATLSYPPDKLPQAYYQLDKVVSQRTNQVDISQKLRSTQSVCR